MNYQPYQNVSSVRKWMAEGRLPQMATVDCLKSSHERNYMAMTQM